MTFSFKVQTSTNISNKGYNKFMFHMKVVGRPFMSEIVSWVREAFVRYQNKWIR